MRSTFPDYPTKPSLAFAFFILALFWIPVVPAAAEMTDSQRNLLRQSSAAMQACGTAFQAGKFSQSSDKLREAMLRVGEALEGADADVYQAASRLIDQIERAHASLQLEGEVLPPFDKPVHGKPWKVYVSEADIVIAKAGDNGSDSEQPSGTRPSRTRPTKKETPEPSMQTGISFVNQVAPILMSRCGNCHVTGNRGQFSMQSYAVLIKGPAAGVVVFPGDPVGSRLIETIETGDMPRGGGKVPAAELQLLKDWITEGAKFDGRTPAAPLSSYASAGSGPAPDMTAASASTVPRSSGNETVSFAKQVAPLLVENCTGCHLDAMQIRGGLNMNTLASLMRGGDSGPVVNPGDGDGSLLVRKLRGQEGARMPAGGRPALPEESIQLISTWIKEGARLDEGTPEQNLRVMVTDAWAKNATHEELAARRQEMANANWKLGAPADARDAVVTIETDDVLVLGNVDKAVAEAVAKAASDALTKARAQIPTMDDRKDTGKSKYRGRVTLFVFPKRYDYGEFSKMVESRSIPAQWDVHWRYNGVDAYVSMVASPEDSPKNLAGRLTAPMASLAVAQLGEAPRWFQEGIGRAIASKTPAREFDGWKTWDQQLPDAVAVVKDPKELIENRLPPEQADLIGYGIGKKLLDRQWRPQFTQLLKSLHGGAEFDQAFAGAFRMPLENFVKAQFGY